MNFRLIGPSHYYHHIHGAYNYSRSSRYTILIRWLSYYLQLIGLLAFANQVAGFMILFVPSRFFLPIQIELKARGLRIRYVCTQLLIVCFIIYCVGSGGWCKFVLFEIYFCFVWSMLQNVAHYSLRGIDKNTNRLCAHTYLLEKPFYLLTFGSTSHLAHHVDMRIPGLYLYQAEVIAMTEKRLGIVINVRYGIIRFVLDILRQFKGPVPEQSLNTSWIKPDPSRML